MKRIFPVCAFLIAGAITATDSIDNGLLSLGPANAQLFVGLDVQKTKSSDFGHFLLTKSQTDDLHFQQFMDKTGFDPRRDLQSILLVTVSNLDAAKGPSAFAIMARGTAGNTVHIAFSVPEKSLEQLAQATHPKQK
jgi:hypothetical protein